MRLVKLAVACVNQTPLAWDDNFAHLRAAIERARAEGVTVLCLPELAITGYACEDAFFMPGHEERVLAGVAGDRQLGQAQHGDALGAGALDRGAEVGEV